MWANLLSRLPSLHGPHCYWASSASKTRRPTTSWVRSYNAQNSNANAYARACTQANICGFVPEFAWFTIASTLCVYVFFLSQNLLAYPCIRSMHRITSRISLEALFCCIWQINVNVLILISSLWFIRTRACTFLTSRKTCLNRNYVHMHTRFTTYTSFESLRLCTCTYTHIHIYTVLADAIEARTKLRLVVKNPVTLSGADVAARYVISIYICIYMHAYMPYVWAIYPRAYLMG